MAAIVKEDSRCSGDPGGWRGLLFMYSLVLTVGGDPRGGTFYETMDAILLGDALKFPFKRWLGFVNWKGGVGAAFLFFLLLCVRSELFIRCLPLLLSDLLS